MVYEMQYIEQMQLFKQKMYNRCIRFEYIVTNTIIILTIFMPILLKTEQTQYL